MLLLKPGVPADFEQRLLVALPACRAGLGLRREHAEEPAGTSHFKLYTIPLAWSAAVWCCSCCSMVGFWHAGRAVAERHPPHAGMGVRRAMGPQPPRYARRWCLELLCCCPALARHRLRDCGAVPAIGHSAFAGLGPVPAWRLVPAPCCCSAYAACSRCTPAGATRQDPVEENPAT